MGRRWKYALLGNVIGLLIVSAMFLTLSAVSGRRPHWQLEILPVATVILSGGNLAIYFAERKGKIKPIDRRPLTLFPRTPDPPVATGSHQ